jgi:hypothetical protein
MATNRQVAYLAAAKGDAEDPADVKNRAEALFTWLQAQANAGNAQFALLAACEARGSDDPGDITARATALLGELGAETAGNGTP